MGKSVKWILISLVGGAALLFIVKAATRKGDEGLTVTAEAVKKRTVTETVTASGNLYPETEVKIASPISGEVTELYVQEGDTVKKGQVLARIQGDRTGSSMPRLSIPNLPPGLEGLVQGMQPKSTGTASSATITAPINGTVTMLAAKKGERTGSMQMAGYEMMRIADMNNLEVRVDVNENNIIKVSTGDSADVEIEAYNKRKFKGVVTGIANGTTKRGDVQSMMSANVTSYEVHVRLLPATYADLMDTTRRRRAPFRPGMNARADIKTQRKEGVLTVPVGAVTARAKGSDETVDDKKKEAKKEPDATDEPVVAGDELEEAVYIVKADGTAEKRVVTTGIQDMNYFEITSGLKEGDQVVSGPFTMVSKTVRTGKRLKVVSKTQLTENK